MENKKKKERGILILLIVGVLIMSVGFALYTTTLNINGTVNVKGSPWNVHYDKSYGTNGISTTSGSVSATSQTINTDDTNFAFTVTLEKPGDYYEATLKAYNEGSMDAILKSVTLGGVSSAQQAYLSYTVTYGEDTYTTTTTGLNDSLAAGAKKDVVVRIEYLQPAQQSSLPTSDVTVNVTGGLLYESE
ncbi:MAG: hypothetical protein IKG56_05500 [Clostridia bacterium]|nr:hypothetical protein [Clostridia bacterium]